MSPLTRPPRSPTRTTTSKPHSPDTGGTIRLRRYQTLSPKGNEYLPMKRTLSVLALTALAATVPAHAAILAVSFTGTVFQTQGATGQAIGSTVMGHFDLNSTTGSYLDFTIGGKSVATGYMSSATIGPALTDAIYMAQLSPVSTGMPSNSTFSLDLSSLTTWPSTDTAYTLLTDTTQLTTNLDTINKPSSAFPSTFGYYTANSNGT